jgi:hypothetical protein
MVKLKISKLFDQTSNPIKRIYMLELMVEKLEEKVKHLEEELLEKSYD